VAERPAPSRVLLVRLGALGDIVHAIPVAARLRREFPAARIDWLDAGRIKTTGDVVDQLVDRLLQAPLDGRRRWGLLRALGANREDAPYALDGEQTQQQLRTAVHLLMSMPEYQLA